MFFSLSILIVLSMLVVWCRLLFSIPLNCTRWTEHIIQNHYETGVQVDGNVNSTRNDAQLNPMLAPTCKLCWSESVDIFLEWNPDTVESFPSYGSSESLFTRSQCAIRTIAIFHSMLSGMCIFLARNFKRTIFHPYQPATWTHTQCVLSYPVSIHTNSLIKFKCMRITTKWKASQHNPLWQMRSFRYFVHRSLKSSIQKYVFNSSLTFFKWCGWSWCWSCICQHF